MTFEINCECLCPPGRQNVVTVEMDPPAERTRVAAVPLEEECYRHQTYSSKSRRACLLRLLVTPLN